MDYFILNSHDAYPTPRIKRWAGKLDKKTLEQKVGNYIEKNAVFEIDNIWHTKYDASVYTDIVTHPCFIVSKKVKDTIKLYDENLHFERICLQDRKINRTYIYYLPKISTLDVLTSNVTLSRDKQSIQTAEIDLEKSQNKVLFQVKADVTCLMIHRNVVESLLRRGVIGMDLLEVSSAQKKEENINDD